MLNNRLLVDLGIDVIVNDKQPIDMLATTPRVIARLFTMYYGKINHHDVVVFKTTKNVELQRYQQVVRLFDESNQSLVMWADEINQDIKMYLRRQKIGYVDQTGVFLPFISLIEENDTRSEMKWFNFPATQQLVVIGILYSKLKDNRANHRIDIEALGKVLQVSPMTISRTLNNLVENNWLRKEGYTRSRKYYYPTELSLVEWMNAVLTMLPSPVKLQQNMHVDSKDALVAGLTALEKYTLITDDDIPTIVTNEPKEKADAPLRQVQTWGYNPKILHNIINLKNDLVDPLSLYLSLKDSADVRVQQEINRMLVELQEGGVVYEFG